jgi:hypothetical protein
LITKVADAAASHPPGLNAHFRPDANICLAKASSTERALSFDSAA